MKTHCYLVLALALVLEGCAEDQKPDVGGQRTGIGVLADGGQTSDLRLPASVLPPPPLTNEIVFHFIYPYALTNGFIQSSTDLVHWETRTDFIVDDANTWTLRPDPAKPMEFFRAGGEAIGK